MITPRLQFEDILYVRGDSGMTSYYVVTQVILIEYNVENILQLNQHNFTRIFMVYDILIQPKFIFNNSNIDFFMLLLLTIFS